MKKLCAFDHLVLNVVHVLDAHADLNAIVRDVNYHQCNSIQISHTRVYKALEHLFERDLIVVKKGQEVLGTKWRPRFYQLTKKGLMILYPIEEKE